MSLARFTLDFLGFVGLFLVATPVFIAWMYFLCVVVAEKWGLIGMFVYVLATAYILGTIGVLTS